jgi:hypothetical protein
MPKTYRSMKKDEDGKPVVEPSAKGLGVRVAVEADVDLDAGGYVLLNGRGMSVAPAWRDLPPHRISKRLRDKFPNARGPLDMHCFCMGGGPFSDGPVTDALELRVDRPDHGVVAPREFVPIDRYQADLAATRDLWTPDEA